MVEYLLLVTIAAGILIYISLHRTTPRIHQIILVLLALIAIVIKSQLRIVVMFLNLYAIALALKNKEYNILTLLVFLEFLLIYASILTISKPVGAITTVPYQALILY